MAIARESATQVTSLNFSLTNTAGTILVFTANVGGTLTSLKWNGADLTQAVTSGSGNAQIWYLLNPDLGTHNLVATGTVPYDAGYAMFYTGATISGDTFAGTSTTGTTTISVNITVGASTYWVVAGVRCSAGSGQSNNGGVASNNLVPGTEDHAWDSNGTVSSGSQLVSYIRDPRNWFLAAISLAPSGAAPTAAAPVPTLLLMNVG